jgi:hypothetical protein
MNNQRIRAIAGKIGGFRINKFGGKIFTDLADYGETNCDLLVDRQIIKHTKQVLLDAMKEIKQQAKDLGYKDPKAAGLLKAAQLLKKSANEINI